MNRSTSKARYDDKGAVNVSGVFHAVGHPWKTTIRVQGTRIVGLQPMDRIRSDITGISG